MVQQRPSRRKKGLELVLQHPILELEFLGQCQHDGRRSRKSAKNIPPIIILRRDFHLLGIYNPSTRRYRISIRGPGRMGHRVHGERSANHFRELAKNMDRDRLRVIGHRIIRSPVEQQRFSASGDGGFRILAGVLRAPVETF